MDVDTPAQPSSAEPLFLFDDDSDVEFVGADRDKPPEPQETAPATSEQTEEPNLASESAPFDLESYQKESLARHQRELNKTRKSVVISDSGPQPSPFSTGVSGTASNAKTQEASPSDKKTRKKPIRLDEGLLLSSKGFPQLIKDTKDFKVRGKGHEAADLDRLLQIYQFWTHQLHPKTQFRDAVLRIEKLCHSRRMLSALGVWRDEAHGTLEGDLQLSNGESDLNDANQHADDIGQEQVPTSATNDVYASLPPSRAPSHPPTTDVESEPSLTAGDISDSDMDALIQEYSKEPQDMELVEDPAALEDYFASTAPPPGFAPANEAALIAEDVPMTDTTRPAQLPAEEDEYWGEDLY